MKIQYSKIMFLKWTAVSLVLLITLPLCLVADGIPEPGLVMYGAVRNATNNIRVITGTLNWTITPSAAGSSVVVTTPLSDIASQYSYILRVPFETIAGSAIPSTNTL